MGAGFVAYHKKERIQADNYSLPNHTTVFQAELEAIYRALKYLNDLTATLKVGYVKILCDSQAAIMALASHKIKSLTVMKTIDELNTLANKVPGNPHKRSLFAICTL